MSEHISLRHMHLYHLSVSILQPILILEDEYVDSNIKYIRACKVRFLFYNFYFFF